MKDKGLDKESPILTIGAVAESLNIHIRTLRIYDEEGLLSPKRSKYNKRLYSLNDIERAKFILMLTRNFAINIIGVKIIIKILEREKIKPENYAKYMQKIAKSLNISDDVQQDNQNVMTKRCKGYKSALK